MPSIIQEIKTQIYLASTTNSILFSEAKKKRLSSSKWLKWELVFFCNQILKLIKCTYNKHTKIKEFRERSDNEIKKPKALIFNLTKRNAFFLRYLSYEGSLFDVLIQMHNLNFNLLLQVRQNLFEILSIISSKSSSECCDSYQRFTHSRECFI